MAFYYLRAAVCIRFYFWLGVCGSNVYSLQRRTNSILSFGIRALPIAPTQTYHCPCLDQYVVKSGKGFCAYHGFLSTISKKFYVLNYLLHCLCVHNLALSFNHTFNDKTLLKSLIIFSIFLDYLCTSMIFLT